MPIYEYQCPHCGRVFEEWVKVSEAHGEEPCPDCGTKSPRLISHTSFVLKGGGWYVTEYGYRKDVKEDGEKKAETEKKTEEGASKDQSQKSPSESAACQTEKSAQAAEKKPSSKESTVPKATSATTETAHQPAQQKAAS